MVGRPSKIDFNKLLTLITYYVNENGFQSADYYAAQKFNDPDSIWGQLCISYFSSFSVNHANLIKKHFNKENNKEA